MERIRVRDLYTLELFGKMRLLAGGGGLDNPITSCGLLDYEYDASVREKYSHTNFLEGQFVLTSLLYAKDNPFLLEDAVKNLISRGCSGLVIKNVFKLPIHESLVRYVDSKNFPIFLVKDEGVFFEDLIYQVTYLIRRHADIHFYAGKADRILGSSGGEEELAALAYAINPSFMSDIVCYFCYSRQPLAPVEYLEITLRDAMEALLSNGDRVFYYKNGAMVIHTDEMVTKAQAAQMLQSLAEVFGGGRFYIGASAIHHRLTEIKSAMQQAIYAALLHMGPAGAGHPYGELGSFRAVMPFCESGEMQAFSREYLDPVREYDLENGAKLLETVQAFVLQQGDAAATAALLGQHKNTVRYRLDALNKLVGVNVFSRQGYEQMALAVRVWIAARALGCFAKPPYFWEADTP